MLPPVVLTFAPFLPFAWYPEHSLTLFFVFAPALQLLLTQTRYVRVRVSNFDILFFGIWAYSIAARFAVSESLFAIVITFPLSVWLWFFWRERTYPIIKMLWYPDDDEEGNA